jgi:hypothetical protein
MLRVLAAVPASAGTSIDLVSADLARGRDNPVSRGLADRVSFVHESAVGTTRGPVDLVLCVGSSHVLTDAKPPQHTIDALHALRRLANPGGRADTEEWLAGQPDHPQAAAKR